MAALHIYITPGFLQIIGESCGKVHAEQLLEIDKEPGAARLSSRVKESRYRPEKIIFDSWYRTELYFQPFQIYCTRVVSQSIIPKLWWRKLRLSSTNNWKKFVIGEFMGCFEVCSGMECVFSPALLCSLLFRLIILLHFEYLGILKGRTHTKIEGI